MNQTPNIPKAPRVPSIAGPVRVGAAGPAMSPSAAPPRLEAAKWPPDDDGLPSDGMGGGMGGASFSGGGGDDGNFKKGRFKPIAIVLGLLAVAAGAGIFVLGGAKDAEKMSPKQVAEEKKVVALLPIA